MRRYSDREKAIAEADFEAKYPNMAKLDAAPKNYRHAVNYFLEWLETDGKGIYNYLPAGDNGEALFWNARTGEAVSREEGNRVMALAYHERSKAERGIDYNPHRETWQERIDICMTPADNLVLRWLGVDPQALSVERTEFLK